MLHHRLRSVLAVIAMPIVSMTPAAATAPVGAPVDAIWHVKQIGFHFRAEPGNYHSCETLHDKITAILRAVGAGVVAVELDCARNSLTNNAHARLSTTVPVEANEANIRAATTFSARSQLVARVRDVALPTAENIEHFPAEWRSLSVGNLKGAGLGPGDCALLRGLSEQVFPQLTVRVVRERLSCSPARLRPVLVVEALTRREA